MTTIMEWDFDIIAVEGLILLGIEGVASPQYA